MKILEWMTTLFINTFGITQPTDKQRRRASWFIVGLTVVALLVVVLIGVVLSQVIRR